ncbi:hypothetical protein H6G89_10945 [Oscillatoria sp. FACHB-1407]|uniref:hypothetical protein n=1 Tax=Oscillatoria sp. FACHB-1407 TaxID=2692847 RepID=UPI001688C04A|nr:hypothetical protein [Oscillatoria sp. FACHB-1407]MBD2461566.1 hypothetical protein [Oscillatoria sp. FACHB-1407]
MAVKTVVTFDGVEVSQEAFPMSGVHLTVRGLTVKTADFGVSLSRTLPEQNMPTQVQTSVRLVC